MRKDATGAPRGRPPKREHARALAEEMGLTGDTGSKVCSLIVTHELY
jgi:hypothetical protein